METFCQGNIIMNFKEFINEEEIETIQIGDKWKAKGYKENGEAVYGLGKTEEDAIRRLKRNIKAPEIRDVDAYSSQLAEK